MYRLRLIISIALILVIVVSSTIVVATSTSTTYGMGRDPNRLRPSIRYNPENGYEKTFEGMKLEYLGIIHYKYTEITNGREKTNYTDTTFDFYLTIKSIDKDSVTYSGKVHINRLFSDDPSDKEYVRRLANMYNFDSLTKQLGYPVISITDYIKGFLEDSDLHAEKWESEANLAELSGSEYTIVIASYEFNISGKVDISGAKNAYFVLTGYADYHDYLSIPIHFHVEATVTAETDTQKIIIQQEISLVLKSEYLKNLVNESNVASEYYSVGRNMGIIRITAKDIELRKEKSEEGIVLLTVNGEGLGFMGIEVKKPLTIEKILVDGVEQEYITLFKGSQHTIIMLPLSLSEHTVKIYFKGIETQEETTHTPTTVLEETSPRKTTKEVEKPGKRTTTVSRENDILLYIIAGGFTILIILMIIILILVLVFRKK